MYGERNNRFWRNQFAQTDPNEPIRLDPPGEREAPLPGATMRRDGYDVCSRRPRDLPPGEFRDYDDQPSPFGMLAEPFDD